MGSRPSLPSGGRRRRAAGQSKPAHCVLTDSAFLVSEVDDVFLNGSVSSAWDTPSLWNIIHNECQDLRRTPLLRARGRHTRRWS